MKTLRFTVARKPVSSNDGYIRAGFNASRGAGGGKGLILTAEAKAYKHAVAAHAVVAAAQAGWPKPAQVKRAQVEIVVWNTRHDCSAAEKFTCDAMEGIVYANDRAAKPRINDAKSDGGAPRVEVTVTLLEVAA